jgi:hypothetical protein
MAQIAMNFPLQRYLNNQFSSSNERIKLRVLYTLYCSGLFFPELLLACLLTCLPYR